MNDEKILDRYIYELGNISKIDTVIIIEEAKESEKIKKLIGFFLVNIKRKYPRKVENPAIKVIKKA